MNFWKKLNKPFFCLAPMSDVTDIAFRRMLAKYGKNRENKDSVVFWTEFVAADGLANKLAKKKLSHILKYSEAERPILAQVFGANEENMETACRYIASLGFDGIDINMGCPDKSVIAQGAGSALIKTPELAKKIINAAKRGIKSAGVDIPLSVKTRIGFNKEDIDNWIPILLKENISALTVHLRTTKELSLVPAHWILMKKVIELRDKINPDTLIIGNGDVVDLNDAENKIKEFGCDGVMIGRGVFGNPWFFKRWALKSSERADLEVSLEERLLALIEHTQIFDKELLKPKHKNFAVMKKHFKAYVKDPASTQGGFPGAKELRMKLMETNNAKEVEKIIKDFLKTK
ncbi:MAG: tRNA-dihydrouridine synthase [Burkholderiales bacterium]|nr:tRNA-dihydrouridine synthase [Burkholderiales bacterium]